MKISCFVAVGVFACILQKTCGTNSVCDLPRDEGPCFGYFPRYYYDAETSQCLAFVFGGCLGNENNFESVEECQADCAISPPSSSSSSSSSVSTACNLPPDAGPCFGFFSRYYYNGDINQCQGFVYGGCLGNENNFESVEECQAECAISPPSSSSLSSSLSACNLPPDTGPCFGFFPRYYYDVNTRHCQYFDYGGCAGNENNFESLDECQAECASPCNLPPDTGPCLGFFPRYFYDVNTRQCQFFVFGGCAGNENNFESIGECLSECGV